MMYRKVLIIGLALLAAAAAAYLATRGRVDRPTPAGVDYNILLVSLDTTRADHLGCYGHAEKATPNIDRAAAEGVTFLTCISAVPITLPSHASIFTGTYPFVHAVRDNMSFRLHDKNTTIAETLKQAGYATGAVVGSAVLNTEFNVSQGFDSYQDLHAPPPTPSGSGSGPRAQRRGGEVADLAIEWLRTNASRKFFLFVHFFDPHKTYDPPPEFAEQYSQPYVGEVAYTDSQVGRVLAAIKELEVDDRTLVVIVGDHGEGLGDHQEATHGSFVYDSTLHVPLIFRCPGQVPAQTAIESPVKTIDIAPTILTFVGLTTPAVVQGKSLLPSMIRPPASDGGAYAETIAPRLNFGLSHLLAFREADWKYIHAPRPELYDLVNDPGERNNVASRYPHRANELREKLRALLLKSQAVVDGAEVEVSLNTRNLEALRSLGYVGGSIDRDMLGSGQLALFDDVSGADPKDHKLEINLTDEALHLMEARDLPKAEIVLRQLLEASGDRQEHFSWAHGNLGLALAGQRKHEEAVKSFKNSLAIEPKDGLMLTNLGNSYLELGRFAEAEASYNAALRLRPVLWQTHHGMAIALRGQARHQEAAEHAQIAARLRQGR